MSASGRRVVLRDERHGRDSRYYEAFLDEHGNLHLEGQDLGPATEPVGVDGEYEWFSLIAAADVPRAVVALGGAPGDDVLDVLAAHWTGAAASRLEAEGIAIDRQVW